MREIKFRARETKTGQLIYSERIGITAFWSMWFQGELDLETVGQYTGLKDSSGVGIYEGDILSNADYIDDAHCEFNLGNKAVEWNDECGCWVGIEGEIFEVIGNIYEDSSLLGGE